MTTNDDVKSIQDIINNLPHTYFLSFVGDFCYFLGCQSALTVGDTDTVGDLVIEQQFPFPQTVVVVDHREGTLTESELQDYIEGCSEGMKLTVITRSKPTDEALSLGDRDEVAILGTSDVTHVILDMEVTDLLVSHVQDNDLSDEHAESLTTLGYGTTPDDSPKSDNIYPSVSNQFFDIELLGYDYHENSELDSSGMIVAMEIKSKRDELDITPNNFTFHDEHAYTYSGVRASPSGSDGQFKEQLEEALSPEWATSEFGGGLSVSGGGRCRFIQYFACEGPKQLSKIRYQEDHLGSLFEISDEEIEDHYGIPKHPESSGEYGSWESFAFEITLDGKERERLNNLPDAVDAAIDSL